MTYHKGIEIDPNGMFIKFIRIGNEAFAKKERTSGGATSQFFYHNDHLGSVNVITDMTGARCQLNEYEPWGGVSRSEGPTPGSQPTCDKTHRFTGQELDPETGFYYYGARYYDQEITRFVSPDPFVQSPDNPQNLNRYSYVLNNPQGYTDPSGYFVAADPTGITIVFSIPGWVNFLMDLFGVEVGPEKERLINRHQNNGAPSRRREVTVKNGPEKPNNVSVYDSQRGEDPWSQDPSAGNDDLPGPIQLAAGPHGPCRIVLNCGGPGGDWWGRGGGSGPGTGGGTPKGTGGGSSKAGPTKSGTKGPSDKTGLDIDLGKSTTERGVDSILRSDNRTFRRHLENLQTRASQGLGTPTDAETRQILDEALRRGWTIRGKVDTNWVGGRHINLIGPSNETVHFPVPSGFTP